MSLSFIKFIYSTLGPHPPACIGDQAPKLSEIAFARELHLGVKAGTCMILDMQLTGICNIR